MRLRLNDGREGTCYGSMGRLCCAGGGPVGVAREDVDAGEGSEDEGEGDLTHQLPPRGSTWLQCGYKARTEKSHIWGDCSCSWERGRGSDVK